MSGVKENISILDPCMTSEIDSSLIYLLLSVSLMLIKQKKRRKLLAAFDLTAFIDISVYIFNSEDMHLIIHQTFPA